MAVTQIKELVTYLFIVTAKGKSDEIFFPREVLAAQEYYHKCLQAGLSPTITKKDVH
jgi:hypothetical protein